MTGLLSTTESGTQEADGAQGRGRRRGRDRIFDIVGLPLAKITLGQGFVRYCSGRRLITSAGLFPIGEC